MTSRQIIRTQYRQKRRDLSSQQQLEASQKLLTTATAINTFKQANSVACYIANDGEIDPKLIIEYCWQQGKTVLLPVLHPFSKGHLLFVEYLPNSATHKNGFGIEEPKVTTSNIWPLDKIQLIFTPLVAFDSKGNRLGMGGGYYDRSLAPLSRGSLPTQLIGLAHNCQQMDNLATDSWDIPLHGIATPEQFFRIS